jgi:hypothetical protein
VSFFRITSPKHQSGGAARAKKGRISLYSLYNNALYLVQVSLRIYYTKSDAYIFSVTKYFSCVFSYLSTNSFGWILKFYLFTLRNWSNFTSWSTELQNMSFKIISLCIRSEMVIQTLETLERLLKVLHILSLA